jgi:hypothetical protein
MLHRSPDRLPHAWKSAPLPLTDNLPRCFAPCSPNLEYSLADLGHIVGLMLLLDRDTGMYLKLSNDASGCRRAWRIHRGTGPLRGPSLPYDVGRHAWSSEGRGDGHKRSRDNNSHTMIRYNNKDNSARNGHRTAHDRRVSQRVSCSKRAVGCSMRVPLPVRLQSREQQSRQILLARPMLSRSQACMVSLRPECLREGQGVKFVETASGRCSTSCDTRYNSYSCLSHVAADFEIASTCPALRVVKRPAGSVNSHQAHHRHLFVVVETHQLERKHTSYIAGNEGSITSI